MQKLSDLHCKKDLGLYCDDGLAVSRAIPGGESYRKRKEMVRLFDKLGVKISIQTNLKVANFLDVTFDLENNTYYPYRKPNDWPVYISR